MLTHLHRRKIIAILLTSKAFRLPGISTLTLLSREEGKMFTNLTESEKSQSRRNREQRNAGGEGGSGQRRGT